MDLCLIIELSHPWKTKFVKMFVIIPFIHTMFTTYLEICAWVCTILRLYVYATICSAITLRKNMLAHVYSMVYAIQ